jgi:hypothetical protein
MKKAPTRKKRGTPDGMRPEYRFDYSKSRPNRFAEAMSGDAVAVVLDPDVAEVFDSSQSVNAVLRTLISAVRKSNRRGR